MRRNLGIVVSLDNMGWTEAHAGKRLAELERHISTLTAVLPLVPVMVRLSDFKWGLDRVAAAEHTRRALNAIQRTQGGHTAKLGQVFRDRAQLGYDAAWCVQ